MNFIKKINDYINGTVEFKPYFRHTGDDKKEVEGFYLNVYRFEYSVMFGRISLDKCKILVEEVIATLKRGDNSIDICIEHGEWYNEGKLTRKQMLELVDSFVNERIKYKF